MQCTVDNKSETELPGMGRHRLSRVTNLKTLILNRGKTPEVSRMPAPLCLNMSLMGNVLAR